tara:strand:+ start:1907 stop:3151 length:1245 start_codon:yes stop_codon:yes gene_type:complete
MFALLLIILCVSYFAHYTRKIETFNLVSQEDFMKQQISSIVSKLGKSEKLKAALKSKKRQIKMKDLADIVEGLTGVNGRTKTFLLKSIGKLDIDGDRMITEQELLRGVGKMGGQKVVRALKRALSGATGGSSGPCSTNIEDVPGNKSVKQPTESNDKLERAARNMNEVIDLKSHDEEGMVTNSDSTQEKLIDKQNKGSSTISKEYNCGKPTEKEFDGLATDNYNPGDEAKEAFDDIMKGVEDGIDAVGKGFGAGYNFVSNAAKEGGEAIWGGMKDGGNAIAKGGEKAINEVGNFFCFAGDTPIKLSDGRMVLLKDIDLDDVLVNRAIVVATMRIRSNINDPFYQIYSKELSNYIYVTGSHYVKNGDKFIHVRDHEQAKILHTVDDVLYCLVTSTHTIPVGEFTFWDWEDDLIEV